MDYHTWKDWQDEAEREARNKELAMGQTIECSMWAFKDYTYKALKALKQEVKDEIANDIREYGIGDVFEFVDVYLKEAFEGLVLDLGCGDYALLDDVYKDYDEVREGIYHGIAEYAKKARINLRESKDV